MVANVSMAIIEPFSNDRRELSRLWQVPSPAQGEQKAAFTRLLRDQNRHFLLTVPLCLLCSLVPDRGTRRFPPLTLHEYPRIPG